MKNIQTAVIRSGRTIEHRSNQAASCEPRPRSRLTSLKQPNPPKSSKMPADKELRWGVERHLRVGG
jgi:hypothetical protein